MKYFVELLRHFLKDVKDLNIVIILNKALLISKRR